MVGDDVVHVPGALSPELAQATIESIKVLGVLQANKAVKEALADRIN